MPIGDDEWTDKKRGPRFERERAAADCADAGGIDLVMEKQQPDD